MCRNVSLPETNSETRLRSLVERFIADLDKEFSERWRAWTYDFSLNDLRTVVGGLMARQVTIASEVAQAYSCWNYHVGPLFLRAMSEVYITLVWILELPDQRNNRAQIFVEHGIGQQKLEIEHRRAMISGEERDPTEQEAAWIEASEKWINSQRAIFLTKVNVGSWSGISVRKMAEEAGCIDFYNYVYTPWSGVAHSTWQHVGRYNVAQCQNPLHGFHLVPATIYAHDSYILYLAGKYANKTFCLFDRKLGTKVCVPSAYDRLVVGFHEIGSQSINQSDELPGAEHRPLQD